MSHKTIVDYRAGRYPHLAFVEARRIYPAIVTLEDWYFFGLELPGRVGAAVSRHGGRRVASRLARRNALRHFLGA